MEMAGRIQLSPTQMLSLAAYQTSFSVEIFPWIVAATTAVERVAKQVELSISQAARGIYNLVNEKMHNALHNVSVGQGYNPKDFSLVAFGGAGSLHANAVGKPLGAWLVIIPLSPGVLCKWP